MLFYVRMCLMILSVNNINKTYIDNHLLKDVSFHLNEYDKAALIGINGCGKTTMLRLIMGLETCDSGEITISKNTSVGYLPQNALLDSDLTIYEEVLKVCSELINLESQIDHMQLSLSTLKGEALDEMISRHAKACEDFEVLGGYRYKSEVRGVLLGLGFSPDELDQKVNTLSGGQKTRVALGKLLIGRPDIIILDEPTNHLDINSVIWLENYLLNYKGTVLLVSHDRYFLDKIVNKVIEIEGAKATTYDGNYSEYSIKKEILRVAAMNAYLKQADQIKHEEAVISKLRQFNREKSIKRADSRVKMLNKLDKLDKPSEPDSSMQITLIPKVESGRDVLTIEHLSKAYGSNILFKDVSLLIRRGEHVAIIGDNGSGKTTLLKILNDLESPDSGSFKLGSKVTIGYYDQEHHVLNDENTVFEEISNAYPDMNNTEIRNTLAAFLFTGDDVFKRISNLSGGEKGRLSLAKLMLGEANLIILDEPTNHLDITSKEILETALNNYEGTLLYVSHDRYFVNRTADRILELRDHKFDQYLGNYDYYLEKRNELKTDYSGEASKEAREESEVKTDWKQQKEATAARKKLQNRLNTVENEIEKAESLKAALNEELMDPAYATNSAKLNEISSQIASQEELLLNLMEEWEQLSSELE